MDPGQTRGLVTNPVDEAECPGWMCAVVRRRFSSGSAGCPSQKLCQPQETLDSRPLLVHASYTYAYTQLLHEPSVSKPDGINGRDRTNAEGETDFRWSVWDEGHRIQMGENVHSRADDCEAQAVEFCWRDLGHKPDKVTRL